MRDIARRFASGRRLTRLVLTALATIGALVVLVPSALAAGSVTIASVYGNTPISTGVSDAIGFAIANTTSAAQTVTFTDTFPSGVSLDRPIGLTNVTGSAGAPCSNLAVTNPSTGQASNPGDTAVTVSVTVPNVSASSSSKPVCSISLGIVAANASGDQPLTDRLSVGAPAGATWTPSATGLTVLSLPSLSFTAPTAGQSFYLGQVATAAFTCTATDALDSIDSFFGTDDEGNQIQAGAPIDTVDPGTRTLQVDCFSAAGGGNVYQYVTYTVGSYSLSAVRANKITQIVSFKTTVPAGKLIAKLFYGKKVIGTSTVTAAARGSIAAAVKPTVAGKRLLAGLKGRFASLKLQTSFNPQAIGTGGLAVAPAAATVLTRTVRLPLVRPVKKKAKAASPHGKLK